MKLDTGQDAGQLRLERSWSPKWQVLLFKQGNKNDLINHYAVVLVDFCV